MKFIAFVGDSGSGKTHAIRKLLNIKYNGYIPTDGPVYYSYKNLILIDTSNDLYDDYEELKDVDGVVIMNSLIREFKTEEIDWEKKVKEYSPNSKIFKFTTFTELEDFLLKF